eukprot:g19206.t1
MHQKKHHCLQFLSCLDQFIAARYAQPASTADATCSRPEAGEEVTISYFSCKELFEATMERRMRLRISKDFHCLCQRCSEHWDRSRGVRCRCGSLRFLAAEGSDLSPCDAGCAWPAVEVTKREELLVQLCRQQADADRATRLATAQSLFRRNAWELPPPETVPSNWWEKKGSDDRLNVRTTPPEWIQSTTPPWTARAGHVALVDPETNAVFILGGEGPSGYMADMWKEAFSINLVNLYNMLELGFLQVTSAF